MDRCDRCGVTLEAGTLPRPGGRWLCEGCRLVTAADPGHAHVPVEARSAQGGGLSIVRGPDGVTLAVDDFVIGGLVIVVFGLAWIGLVAWTGWQRLGQGPGPELAALGVALLIGAGITYYGLVRVTNRTEVRVAGGQLEVTSGPLPWGSGRRVALDQITRVLLEEKTLDPDDVRGLGTGILADGRSTRVVTSLVAELTDGRRLTLLRDLEDHRLAVLAKRELDPFVGAR